jgi:hexosaminidase
MLRFLLLASLAITVAACGRPSRPAPFPAPFAPAAVIPAPTSLQLNAAERFVIDSTTSVLVPAEASAEVERVARVLCGLLSPAGPAAPRRLAAGESPPPRSMLLALALGRATLGGEGYELEMAQDRVTLRANDPAGLFYGVQTIRQLLPVAVEHPAAVGRALWLPVGRVVDAPRFGWRGAMLDVSRHFLPPTDVERFIDLLALYKMNRLHLHLADDQGWRIEITSWPNLALKGGSTQVGGAGGGYYTQSAFADIVAYARDRFITIVPEIDMPGHINAALASYGELSCDGVARQLYTGIRVGFSTLCVARDTVYRFVDDVVREIAALTPGPYFHIGGDEVQTLTREQYRGFVERVQRIVRAHGKEMIGWGEIAPANLVPTTIVQNWKTDSSAIHVARGGKVILSPGKRLYLDMKYDSSTVLGLRWAGLIDLQTAYDWDPATYLSGVPESAILGVEAPLWAETVVTRTDYEYMAFPRLVAVAEVGWTSQARRWADFRLRLGAQGARLAALGVNFYRSPQVPWSR